MKRVPLILLAAGLISLPVYSQQQHSTTTGPTPTNPTKNNPDVPKQEPGTDNPDLAPENHPVPGGTGSTSTTTKSKRRHKSKSTSTSGTTSSGE